MKGSFILICILLFSLQMFSETIPTKSDIKKTKGILGQKLIAKRLYSFPENLSIAKIPDKYIKTDLAKDKELQKTFLMRLAKDVWGYFRDVVDKENHLPLDNIRLGKKNLFDSQTAIGDYTNITNIGMYLISIICADKLGFIDKNEAVKRISATLKTINNKMDKYNNIWLFNYYNTTDLSHANSFVSFVDSGWLSMGIFMVSKAYPELLKECTAYLKKQDYNFFYAADVGHMYHGYDADKKSYSKYHYGAFFTEPRLISLFAIAKSNVDIKHWFRMYRVFPPDWDWQNQIPKGQKVKYHGVTIYEGCYEHNGIKYIPSWGGSMFEALMPTLLCNEIKWFPKSLGENVLRHIKLQRDFAYKEKKYSVWGFSPSSTKDGGYSEFGVDYAGIKGYDDATTITPHATFLTIPFQPTAAIENLQRLLEKYPDIYGPYGFYDAVEVSSGKNSKKYLALDQGMSLIPLTNYLTSGYIYKLFEQDKDIHDLLKELSKEEFNIF